VMMVFYIVSNFPSEEDIDNCNTLLRESADLMPRVPFYSIYIFTTICATIPICNVGLVLQWR
jgi:hypothetical protein